MHPLLKTHSQDDGRLLRSSNTASWHITPPVGQHAACRPTLRGLAAPCEPLWHSGNPVLQPPLRQGLSARHTSFPAPLTDYGLRKAHRSVTFRFVTRRLPGRGAASRIDGQEGLSARRHGASSVESRTASTKRRAEGETELGLRTVRSLAKGGKEVLMEAPSL